MKKRLVIGVIGAMLLQYSYVKSAPPSLSNCGNTCFLNASIQVLYNIRPLTDLLLKGSNPYAGKKIEVLIEELNEAEKNRTQVEKDYKTAKSTWDPIYKKYKDFAAEARKSINEYKEGFEKYEDIQKRYSKSDEDYKEKAGGVAAYYYYEIIQQFNVHKSEAKPFLFLCDDILKYLDENAYKIMGVSSCSQQDASEFIIKFLNVLIEKKDDIRPIFQFQHYSELECPGAIPSRTTTFERYLALPTQNEKNENLMTLGDCFKQYFIEEQGVKVDGKICIKKLMLGSSPEILMVILKRYTATLERLSHTISIPEELNIAEFVENGKDNALSHEYDLIGIAIQGGGLSGGHYWAYVKDKTGTWYKCDDSSITPGSYALFKDDMSQNGYFLVYQRTPIEEAARRDVARKEQEKREQDERRRKEQEELRKKQEEAARKEEERKEQEALKRQQDEIERKNKEARQQQEQLKALQADLSRLQAMLQKLQEELKKSRL